MEKVYENIRKYRIDRGMSQREFARQMGYTAHTMVSRIEAGEVDLPYSKILKAAEVLEVSPPVLMGFEAEITPAELQAVSSILRSIEQRGGGDGSL